MIEVFDIASESPVMSAATYNHVVVFSAKTMGDGDDDLDRILMKSFVFALTQLDILPDCLIFYNGSAALCLDDSPALSDLQAIVQIKQSAQKVIKFNTHEEVDSAVLAVKKIAEDVLCDGCCFNRQQSYPEKHDKQIVAWFL